MSLIFSLGYHIFVSLLLGQHRKHFPRSLRKPGLFFTTVLILQDCSWKYLFFYFPHVLDWWCVGFFFLNLSFKWWLSWVQKSLWKNRINLGLKKMKVFYSISFFVWLRILIFKLILNEILFLLFSLFSHSLVVLAWPSGPQTRPGLIWQIVGPATEGYGDITGLAT